MARTPKHFYILAGAWRRFAPPDIVFYDDDFVDDAPDDEFDLDAPDDEFEGEYADVTPSPLWARRRRIMLTIIILIMLIALLAYTFQGIFLPPPPPTLAPGSLI